ncbi:MAG: glycine oxidase ThiO [Gammaproteobacteria bacterium]|nr:glycine oxidase ThiO [Gammaproteobacteria bacterium]MDH5651153.1 glycine oxidase ThiO [Gammaproteobacteria bacterium]
MHDCLIVGGGLIGMLTARELALGGLSVAIIERGTLGQESTWAGGGIISPLYPWRYPDPVTRLAAWSQQVYPSLAADIHRESGVDPEWTQNGLLIVDSDEIDAARHWSVTSCSNLEIVSQQTCRTLEPQLGSMADNPGIWLPDVAQVRNPRLIKAMRGSLAHLGVTVREQTEVQGLDIRDGQAAGVRLGRTEILLGGQVVVAGGAWTARLLQEYGHEVQVRPVRGQMLLYKTSPGLVSRIVLSKDRYVIPRRDGRVLVGSTLEETGFEKITTDDARHELEAEAARIIPILADFPVEHHWAGLRPGTPAGIPYICEHPSVARLYINAGHFRNGVVLGPASARLLADQILGNRPILDLKPYNICV